MSSSSKNRTRTRWLLLFGLVVQLLLLAVALASRTGASTSPFGKASQATVPTSALPLTIESGAPVAQEYADRWSLGVNLIAATLKLDWSGDESDLQDGQLPRTGLLVYVFSDGSRTLSIYLDRGTGLYLANGESEFGGGKWSPLDLTTYPKSSAIAAAAADITSGSTYRHACPGFRSSALVTASAIVGSDGKTQPIWTVTYGDSRFDGTFDVLVRMNAMSGNVIDNQLRERACD